MTGAVTLTAPVLTTVPRVELGAVGRWNITNIEGWEPSPDDMASAVAALACPAVRRPVLKFGHDGQHGTGDPAIGYIDNMAVTGEGQVLVGDYAGIPAWLAAEDDAGRSVLASAYPDRSGEWEHDYLCQLGHTHPFVLHAVALLGVARPGIGTLQSLHDLYANPPEMEPLMPAASLPSTDGRVSAAATTDDVRRAYYAGPGDDWSLYIREMYVDPPELIVQNDDDATLTRVAYAIDADSVVTFAEPQAVKVTYVAARAAASRPLVAFASRAEARPGAAPAPPAAPAAVEDPVPEFTEDQLTEMRELLDLAEDADEEAIVAALDEALAELAADTPASGALDLPAGTVAIDAAVLAALQADARAGVQARTEQLAEHRQTLVAAAVNDGRIPAARREHWARRLEADEGAAAVLASLQPGVSLVGASAGHQGRDDPPDAGSADALYESLFGKEG